MSCSRPEARIGRRIRTPCKLQFRPTGELAYVPGGPLPAQDQAVVWVDRNGGVRALPLPVAEYRSPRLSPDGRRVTFDSRGLNRSIWVYDLERGTSTAITQAGTPAYRRLDTRRQAHRVRCGCDGPPEPVLDAGRRQRRARTPDDERVPSVAVVVVAGRSHAAVHDGVTSDQE